MSANALIILAEGFEDVEAVTPIDILRRAQVNVTVAGLEGKTVKGSRGINIVADALLDEVINNPFEVVVLPGGGGGAERLSKSAKVAELIRRFDKEKKLIAAICAAPAVVLAPLGVLDGKNATCFMGDEGKFHSSTRFVAEPVVKDGHVITSRALGTALAFSLAIVEALCGADTAVKIKKAVLG